MSSILLHAGPRLAVGLLAITTIFQNCGGGSSSTPATPAATPVPIQAHAAYPADSIVDSIGINTHLGQTNYPAAMFPQLDADLVSLGVRHVRDSSYPTGTQAAICANDAALASNDGIHFDFVTTYGMTPTDITNWIACAAGATESFEPYNEFDLTHPAGDTNWPQQLDAFQPVLYQTVKSAASNVLVLGPALTSGGAYESVGNLSAYLDYGNIHSYQAGFYPETSGFGSGGYGSLQYNNANGALVSGTKPQYITETSYSTAGAKNTVDDATQAKYVDRLLLNDFAISDPKSFIYELLDEPNITQPAFNDAGLITAAGVPKPSYDELMNTIAILSDRGAPFTTTPLTYGIGGDTANLDSVLAQKRDGDYYLAVWLAVESYDPNAESPIVVPPQSIAIEFPAATGYFEAVTSFDANGNAVTSPTQGIGSVIPLSVTDNVQIVHLSKTAF